MSETKHTPGPWRAGFADEKARATEMIVRAEQVDGQPYVAVCRCNFGGIDIEANALLIAAAPAYQMAWLLVPDDIKGRIFDSLYKPDTEWVEAAIAKSEGSYAAGPI